MGQFVGVLGLLLSETPVLPLNATRYATALQEIMKNTQQNDTRFRMNETFLFLLFVYNIIL
jgi:hypothetical protein